MRNAFCAALVALSESQRFTFFTGDLGFMALESLQAALGPRFINAGVAEENMVSVAAGASSAAEPCWAYSIAPFLYARAFEQVRNDVCLHKANVKLVGNGGGYGYGVMGATHHALEDYGVLLTLPHMTAYVPAFADDLAPIAHRMTAETGPAYLRLGRCEKPKGFTLPGYAPWRLVLTGDAGVLIVVGPNAGGVLAAALELTEAARPEIWVVSELRAHAVDLPAACVARIATSGAVFVLEEHVPTGSFGQMLALTLLLAGVHPPVFRHYAARGYISGRYGSQAFHRAESGLAPTEVLADIQHGARR